MEINPEKTKLMTNNTSDINTEIKVNGQKLETVTSFKYLGSLVTDEGSKSEILSRLAKTTAALTRLKPVSIDKSIIFMLVSNPKEFSSEYLRTTTEKLNTKINSVYNPTIS